MRHAIVIQLNMSTGTVVIDLPGLCRLKLYVPDYRRTSLGAPQVIPVNNLDEMYIPRGLEESLQNCKLTSAVPPVQGLDAIIVAHFE